MTCVEANQLDLVEYLDTLGFQAKKINRNDYWYLSPLRDEKEASFKVNRKKNVWYDHGIGKGGSLIDFAMEFHKCNVGDVMQKLSNGSSNMSIESHRSVPIFLPQKSRKSKPDIKEKGIEIISAKQPLSDLRLCRYVRLRRIDRDIALKFLHEIHFKNGVHERKFKAVGFMNASGGFELRNEYFKGSSSPKEIYFLDNKAKTLSVFEGFFDFLTYQGIIMNQEIPPSSFLVLNSLSFFEKNIPLMCSHERINLYLDNDVAGRKITANALTHSIKFNDNSDLYKGYKDINEWIMNFGRVPVQEKMKHTHGKRM